MLICALRSSAEELPLSQPQYTIGMDNIPSDQALLNSPRINLFLSLFPFLSFFLFFFWVSHAVCDPRVPPESEAFHK